MVVMHAIAGAISAADEMRNAATDLTGHGTIFLLEDVECGVRSMPAGCGRAV